MSDDEKAQHESEYKALLALFIALLKNLHTDSKEEALYELCELRAEFAINHALKGMNLSVDEALMLLQNYDDENLTQRDKDIRDRVVAAVNNLIDFTLRLLKRLAMMILTLILMIMKILRTYVTSIMTYMPL